MSPAVLHTICGKPPTVFWFATLTGHAHSDSKSRVNRLPDPPAAEILAPPAAHYDRERVMDCLSKADFGDRLKTLPDGLDTPLYKELDKNGVEVSGGEAQKIDIAGDKTAAYISHRLSSCKFCDDIAVSDHGAIVQYGTRDQLVADENGKYYELWHAQAQYYVKE